MMTSFVTKIRMQFVILTTKEIKLAVENVTYIIHTIFLRSTTTANAYIRKKNFLIKTRVFMQYNLVYYIFCGTIQKRLLF